MPTLNLKLSKPLFATPLFAFQLDDAEQLNQQLITDIGALRQVSAGISRSNQHGWHSERDFFSRPEPSFRTLSRHILQAGASATQKLASKSDVENMRLQAEGWINVNEKGAFNTPHDHPGHLWSGCYYVKIPEAKVGRSGDIEFLDPRGSNAMGDRERSLIGSAAKFRIEPKPGLLLLFPSFLRHWVYPNEEDDMRISIAFNLRVIPAEKPKMEMSGS